MGHRWLVFSVLPRRLSWASLDLVGVVGGFGNGGGVLLVLGAGWKGCEPGVTLTQAERGARYQREDIGRVVGRCRVSPVWIWRLCRFRIVLLHLGWCAPRMFRRLDGFRPCGLLSRLKAWVRRQAIADVGSEGFYLADYLFRDVLSDKRFCYLKLAPTILAVDIGSRVIV